MRPRPPGLRLRWINLDDHVAHVPAYATLLAADERARADRYVVARARRQFVITRALLRITLADFLGTAPAALGFDYGPQSKPFLAWPPQGRALQFNVSHAGDVAVIATTRHSAVGIDLERMRADIDCAQIAERIFTPCERTELADATPAARARAFFDIWTRKEAYVKARGLGLSMPLDSFDVTRAPEALLATRPDPGDAARWSVRGLPAPPGYVAALAYSVRESPP